MLAEDKNFLFAQLSPERSPNMSQNLDLDPFWWEAAPRRELVAILRLPSVARLSACGVAARRDWMESEPGMRDQVEKHGRTQFVFLLFLGFS